jgi:hypothetical protein
MTAQALQNPLPVFTGLDALPLSGGYIYFGTSDQDPEQYPKAVYWDEAMTLVADQPLRTTAGYISRNGAPATVWIDGNCSIRVRDSQNRQVYYQEDWAGFVGAAATAAAAAAESYVVNTRGPVNYTGVVFGWNSDAGLDSARFPAFAEVGPGKVWVSYSPRHSSTNDGEKGMRLDVVQVTYSDANETVTVGTPQTIHTPTGFTSALGATWSCGFHVKQTGANAGRKYIVAQELNSPDGTYTHADSRYDLVLYWTDDTVLPATWTRVLLISGQTAHTTFGLADYNAAAAGFHVPSGNCILEMASGRLVIVGYLPNAVTHHLASLYTDAAGGITGWTAGTPLLYNSSNDNEPSASLTATGLAAFVRNETVNSRSIYRSTDGATWTYSRSATDVPIRNVASCAFRDDEGRIYVGGATTPTTDNRRGYKLYASDDEGVNFGAGFALFEEPQRIGYSCLKQMSDGVYGLMFEVTSVQASVSFNQKSSLGFARFNKSAFEGLVSAYLPLHDGLRFTASEEYSAYAAYVAADTGTMQSASDALAAITSAIAGNYYSKIGLAVSGRWGHKNMGAAGVKLYSLNRVANSGSDLTGGAITLNTASYAYAAVVLTSGSEILFAGTPLHLGNSWGMVLFDKNPIASASNCFGVRWTNSVMHYAHSGGSVYHDPSIIIEGTPIYSVGGGTDAAHFYFDTLKRIALAGENGSDLQSITYYPKYSTNGQTVTFRLMTIAGGPGHMAEFWHFNGVGLTPTMVRQCSTDVDARS